MSRRALRVSAVALALVTAAVVIYPRPWLVVKEGEQWRLALSGARGTTFTLRWMHSVEKEDWEEWFAVAENGAIEITGTRFKTFGAGVPASAGTETRLEDGWVVMTGIDRVVDPLLVQAAAAERYRLIHDGRVIRLSRAAPPPILEFVVIRAPLWRAAPALMRTWLAAAQGRAAEDRPADQSR